MVDSYSDEVAENQGRLFELACDSKYNMEDFVYRFMGSKLRDELDRRNPIKCNMFFDEMLEELLKSESFKVESQLLNPEICCWIGEFYSILRDTLCIRSKYLIKLLPFPKMYSMARTLHDLDMDLAIERVATNIAPVVCFHNPGEPMDFLSNWFYSNFTINGVTFNSVEQYMMYSKATQFKDFDTAQKIMRSRDFRYIKQLGREVKNYDDFTWEAFRFYIVLNGVRAKFYQNANLAAKLVSTGDTLLAECAVRDKIWGIGLSMTDPKRLNPAKWRGENNLGKILMIVRGELLER